MAWVPDGGDDEHAALLEGLRRFVHDERDANQDRLRRIWEQPLGGKLATGLSQGFRRVERRDEQSLWAYLDDGESRFREGDLLCLHGGSPCEGPLGGFRQLSVDLEEDDRWLLRSNRTIPPLPGPGPWYADPDTMDLTPSYERALEEVAVSPVGRTLILPLLAGKLDVTFDQADCARGARVAAAEGFNPRQAEAVSLALGADQIACIQGPPGTGKTRVLGLIARLMVERGDRILMTSHTHLAINNALNQVHARRVPAVKVGQDTQSRGLDPEIACCPSLAAWAERPQPGGYVVGATPFATWSSRLEGFQFDTVLIDEASQVTVPLALMAMRAGRRFIFVGDQKQLPPVLLSRSVLSGEPASAFARLTAPAADHTVMLNHTYRMNRWLTAWPSRTFYGGQLESVGPNRDRTLVLSRVEPRLAAVFAPADSAVFIPTRDRGARTRNQRDAQLVCALCAAAVAGGVPPGKIGVVTPFRLQGRAIRNLLARRLGQAAPGIIADTVERMQGQERELVILSLATGDQGFLAAIAEFFFQPERLNVSVTRSMTKLIVIGPDVQELPAITDPPLARWVAWYREMVAGCRRVDLL